MAVSGAEIAVFKISLLNQYVIVDIGGAVRQTKKVSDLPFTQHWSCRTELTPLGEGGSPSILENLSAGEVAVLVEVVVDRAV